VSNTEAYFYDFQTRVGLQQDSRYENALAYARIKMPFSQTECAFNIERYFTENKSCNRVRALSFQEKFGANRTLPNSSIGKTMRRFREADTLSRRTENGRSVVTADKQNAL